MRCASASPSQCYLSLHFGALFQLNYHNAEVIGKELAKCFQLLLLLRVEQFLQQQNIRKGICHSVLITSAYYRCLLPVLYYRYQNKQLNFCAQKSPTESAAQDVGCSGNKIKRRRVKTTSGSLVFPRSFAAGFHSAPIICSVERKATIFIFSFPSQQKHNRHCNRHTHLAFVGICSWCHGSHSAFSFCGHCFGCCKHFCSLKLASFCTLHTHFVAKRIDSWKRANFDFNHLSFHLLLLFC